eukprot:COSAG06_NODE_39967_length_407_cov_0.340909_1_plen_57_part_00
MLRPRLQVDTGGDQKAQKVVTKYVYTKFFARDLSSIAFASVRDRVCALLRNVLENY